ncbi:MAG: DUF4271 domain-containing protein [Muribaculaceae bacterium]|nr:DUF4271 domain-containing protein [Muribaculaceae bacterium]
MPSADTLHTDTLNMAQPDTLLSATLTFDTPGVFEPIVCREDESPQVLRQVGSMHTGKVAFAEGITPEPRPMLPGYNTGVMCLIIGIFLIISSNFRHYSTFLKTFAQDLWKVRSRQNVFNDHTVSETRVQVSLIMLLCICEGIIIYSAIARSIPVDHIFITIALTSALAAVYYLWQRVAYATIGYVFATEESTTQWVKGFRASQCLLAITLVLPAMIVLFNPGSAGAMIFIGLTLYVTARIIFIFKGFRIFYDNYFSLVYFILYLCTLEIVPPVFICKAAMYLTLLFD